MARPKILKEGHQTTVFLEKEMFEKLQQKELTIRNALEMALEHSDTWVENQNLREENKLLIKGNEKLQKKITQLAIILQEHGANLNGVI